MSFRICVILLLMQFWSAVATAQNAVAFIYPDSLALPDAVSAKLGDLPNNSRVGKVYQQSFNDCSQAIQAIDESISRGDIGIIYNGGCGLEILAVADRAAQVGIHIVAPAFSRRSDYSSLRDNAFFFAYPNIAEEQLSEEFRGKPAQFFEWCADVQLPDSGQGNSRSPLGTCLESVGLPDGMTTTSAAVMLAEIDLMVQLLAGNTPETLSTLFGDIEFDSQERTFKIPGQVVLEADNLSFDNFRQRQGSMNSPEDILGFLCPDCSGKGPICAKGDECPKECGKNACTKTGDKTCCNSAGMPAPEY